MITATHKNVQLHLDNAVSVCLIHHEYRDCQVIWQNAQKLYPPPNPDNVYNSNMEIEYPTYTFSVHHFDGEGMDLSKADDNYLKHMINRQRVVVLIPAITIEYLVMKAASKPISAQMLDHAEQLFRKFGCSEAMNT